MLRVQTARKLAALLWPAFREHEGMILLPFVRPPAPPLDSYTTLTGYERFHSHTHIQDEFRWSPPSVYDAELDDDRPDATSAEHREAWELAQTIGEMWFAKLHADFPSYDFRVYVSRLD